jgi:serine/threonine protein kinase
MTSPPATPPLEVPESPSEYRFEVTPKLCEWAEKYRPGGFHPVNLGDTIDNGRFKLIRKLGNGSSSTVWLAVRQRYRPFEITQRQNLREPLNPPQYVAVKILDAGASAACDEIAILEHLSSVAGEQPDYQHITRLLEHFELQGPNGSHRCLVFEVMSMTAASLAQSLPENHQRRYPVWIANKILLHTLRGIALLHKNEIVHSGIQPTKLLFSTKNIILLCLHSSDRMKPRQLYH